MKTTYIKEQDVRQVADELETIVTPFVINRVLEMFDDEMGMNANNTVEYTWYLAVQELIHFNQMTEMLLSQN